MASDYPRFRVSDVAKAAAMPLPVLQRYLDRHIVVPSPQDHDPGGSGRARLFTQQTARKIGLINALTSVGLSPSAAADLADQYCNAHGVVVVSPRGASRALSPAEFRMETDAAVLVDVDRVIANVDARLPAKAA